MSETDINLWQIYLTTPDSTNRIILQPPFLRKMDEIQLNGYSWRYSEKYSMDDTLSNLAVKGEPSYVPLPTNQTANINMEDTKITFVQFEIF